MVEISNILDEYTKDKTLIVLKKNKYRKDDIEFKLNIELDDVNKLAYNQAKVLSGKFEADTESLMTEQMTIISSIVSKSYKEFTEDKINKLLVKLGKELLLEVLLETGLRDREQFEKLQEAQKKQFDKITKDAD